MTKEKLHMNIMISYDIGYAIPAVVCLTSLFENNKDANINVYVMRGGAYIGDEDKLQELERRYGQKIHIVCVDPKYFANTPVYRWKQETWYRLLIHECLPNNLDRVLWIDCDTVVTKSLADLYTMDMDGHPIAMREDPGSAIRRKEFNLEDGIYWQDGIILYDFKKTKGKLSYERVEEVIHKFSTIIKTPDQDVINILFNNDVAPIERKYNDWNSTSFDGKHWRRLLNAENRTSTIDSVVLHYVLGKPWNRLYSGSCESTWIHYLGISPYANLLSKYSGLKHGLLRTGVIKTIFYWWIPMTYYVNKVASYILPTSLYIKSREWYRKYIK